MTTMQQKWTKEIFCSPCEDNFNVTHEDVAIVECRIFGEFVCDRYAARCPECEQFIKIDEEALPDFVKNFVLKKYGKTALRKHR